MLWRLLIPEFLIASLLPQEFPFADSRALQARDVLQENSLSSITSAVRISLGLLPAHYQIPVMILSAALTSLVLIAGVEKAFKLWRFLPLRAGRTHERLLRSLTLLAWADRAEVRAAMQLPTYVQDQHSFKARREARHG